MKGFYIPSFDSCPPNILFIGIVWKLVMPMLATLVAEAALLWASIYQGFGGFGFIWHYGRPQTSKL